MMGGWRGWSVLLLCLALASCAKPSSEEEALRARLAAVIETIEQRDAKAMEDYLAEDFSGPGGMDRARARATAAAMMFRYRELGVNWTMEELVIQDQRATMRLAAVVTGTATVAGFGGRGRLLTVELGWRLDDGQWQLVAAQWKDKVGG